MPAEPSEPMAQDGKYCRECKEQIPLEALRCKHCDAYQDFRKWLPFSSTILALLIALFSVIGSALPVISSQFERSYSNLSLRYTGGSYQTIFLSATNSGNRAAIVTEPWLFIPHTHMVHLIPGRPIIVDPGKTIILEYKLDPTTCKVAWDSLAKRNKIASTPFRHSPDDFAAGLQVRTIAFGGALKYEWFKVPLWMTDWNGCSIEVDHASASFPAYQPAWMDN